MQQQPPPEHQKTLLQKIEYEISTALDVPDGPYDFRYMEGRKAGLEWALGQVEKAPAASPVMEEAKTENDWNSVKGKLPNEGGRFWCYVEEVNDLGKSRFQWNCSFDPKTRTFSDNLITMAVTHWRYLPNPPEMCASIEPGEQKETPKMDFQLSAESDIAALDFGRLHQRCVGDDIDISSELTEAFESGQSWMYRKLTQPELAPKDPIGEKGEIPEEIMEKIGRLALHEAALHFNPVYSPDQNTACVICYTNGAKEFYLKMREETDQVIENAVVFNRLSVEQANEIAQLKGKLEAFKETAEAVNKHNAPFFEQFKEKADAPRTSLTRRSAKDFYLKVSITSNLLPENEGVISSMISHGIFSAFRGWKNTGVSVEEFNPEIK